MQLYDHPKFDEIQFLKKTVIKHENFDSHT